MDVVVVKEGFTGARPGFEVEAEAVEDVNVPLASVADDAAYVKV